MMMKKIVFILMIGLMSWSSKAAVHLPDVLSDSMVLQRNTQVPIWGKALPGEEVTVTFNGQKKSTKADEEGEWKIFLEPMKANATPQMMTIQGINTFHLRGILIGEVWLCSGQSNMQRILAKTDKGDSVIASADYPLLRLFNVSRDVAFQHKHGRIGEWKNCTPSSVRPFSAAAYYFGLALQKKLGVPVGIINASYGGSQAEAWTPRSYLHTPDLQPCIDREKKWQSQRASVQKKYANALRKWRKYADKEQAAGRKPKGAPHQPEALREYRIAGSIFQAMIVPLIPFAIKGNVWYQGESNEGRAEQYGILLPRMIQAWRTEWGEGRFPFGIVQLPNFRDHNTKPEDEAWSHLRDAQRRTADTVSNTGLIVTIDIGEAHNIHPHDKYDVGKRMCQWALSSVYHKNILPGGPQFDTAIVKRRTMVVSFDNAGSGLRTTDGNAPQEFALAGKDHQWHWAKAKIIGKNKIKVWSKKVKKPIAVRYAFNNNPQHPNLTNDSRIPAAPFRSDHWPGPTHGKR